MKQLTIMPVRAGIDLPRNTFSRSFIKQLDSILKAKAPKNYTGLAGRRICFQFVDEKQRDGFMEKMQDFFSEHGYKFTIDS